MQIVTPKFPEIFQSGAMCKNSLIMLFNWSSLDVKWIKMSFSAPHWMIPVG